ncbi:MAG: hypothetical protein KGM92_07490 [Acidobacteriota bacterium]|jgi:hypothetical protein|nr:hypothetical protein [Acidobacteriota bacterium]
MARGKGNPDFVQMNLALSADMPAHLPHQQQTELALTLAELLIQAWTEAIVKQGGVDESETDV